MTTDIPDATADPNQACDLLLRQEFSLAPDMVFLNHAALGPWPQRTVSAVADFAVENGRDASRHWKNWYAAEQRLRQRLADTINASDPADIALLKNTSEALSLLANGLDWKAGDSMAVLAEEFPSNLWPWQQAATRLPFTVNIVQRHLGQPVHAALIEQCDRSTRLIAVSSVQYATGEAADLRALGRYCKEHGIVLVVDAIQSLGALPIDVQDCPIDALAAGSHKWLLAPEGTGVLYTSPTLRERLSTTQAGWRMTADPFAFDPAATAVASDSRRFEIGTLNTLGIVGLDASLSLYQQLGTQWVAQRVLRNTAFLLAGLASLPVTVGSPIDSCQHSGIVSFSLADLAANQALFRHLSAAGYVTALRAGWLRISPHYHTPIEQLASLLVTIEEFVT